MSCRYTDREYRFLDPDEVRAEAAKHPVEGHPLDVLTDALLDIIQLAESQGMSLDDVDQALGRIHDHQAQKRRTRFSVLPRGEDVTAGPGSA